MKTRKQDHPLPASGGSASASRLWLGIAVVLSILVCATIAWLGYRHGTLHQDIGSRQENLRLARVDLGRGYLHLALADSGDAPFDREEGLALLRQGLATVLEIIDGLPGLEQDTADAFRQSATDFEARLAAWKATGFTHPGRAAEVRIAFRQLDVMADRVDALSEALLRDFYIRIDRQFGWTVGIAAILLVGICFIMFRAMRASDISERA